MEFKQKMQKKGAEPTITWKIRVPASVAAHIELMVMDPITRKPSYGKRSELIASLLRQHLKNVGFDIQKEIDKLYPTKEELEKLP
jgi:hypothetical protein